VAVAQAASIHQLERSAVGPVQGPAGFVLRANRWQRLRAPARVEQGS